MQSEIEVYTSVPLTRRKDRNPIPGIPTHNEQSEKLRHMKREKATRIERAHVYE